MSSDLRHPVCITEHGLLYFIFNLFVYLQDSRHNDYDYDEPQRKRARRNYDNNY